jgi:hypothetical protein
MENDYRDNTLRAADEVMQRKDQQSTPRGYLGMSGMYECTRQVWYAWRMVKRIGFDAATLKRFASGHADEDVFAARLKKVAGIDLITADPATGRQIGHRDISEHFRGHQDGQIRGLRDDPHNWYVWEHKSVNERSFRKFQRDIDKWGEEHALREWNLTYFNQAQLYMYYSGVWRHYLTATTPGCRDDMKCITLYQPEVANALVEKAEEVIFSTDRPAPISTVPEKAFSCKFCGYKDFCTDKEYVARNCRTCLHSEPSTDGDAVWKCNKHNKKINIHEQLRGCPDQRFLPSLVPHDVTFADDTGEDLKVMYRTADGGEWIDGG